MSQDRVEHHATPKAGAFVIRRDGVRAGELTYTREGDQIVAQHTFVDPQFRGGTIARDMLGALVALAREEGRKIIPRCEYVRGAFEKHAEYADVRGPNP
jgi:predicted GNAT family acetyltransferase